MIIVNPNLRITQYYKKKTFAIKIPNETLEVIDVNKTIYKLLKAINDKELNTYKELSKIIGASVIKELYNKRIILNSDEFIYNENVLDQLSVEFPLHAITIELTNACNLDCIHCYGKFGKPSCKKMYTIEEIKELKKELDLLHTMEVRLSGGECFLNPDFEKIATYFLENGFHVSIYTNGYDTEKIINFAESTKIYHYAMAISLDGTEQYHNLIRGNEKAFDNVINTLKKLEKYKNINLLIATAIMKQNYDNIHEVKELSKNLFPYYDQKLFLVTPVKDTDFYFDYNELPQIIDECPELFEDYFAVNRRNHVLKKKHRCQGGVGHGVLTVDGILKICPIAEEEQFVIGDVKKTTLYDVWVNPNEYTKLFRKEYEKSTPQCKICKNKKVCGAKNCRIEALRLTGNYLNANPYACIAVKRYY